MDAKTNPSVPMANRASVKTAMPTYDELMRATRAICELNSGGYCDCVGASMGCLVGRGEAPGEGGCKMTTEALPFTNEYRMALAALKARATGKD